LTPDSAFSLTDWTAYVIFIVIIGGIGRIEGPIVGTCVFFACERVGGSWPLIWPRSASSHRSNLIIIFRLFAERYRIEVFRCGGGPAQLADARLLNET